MVGAEGNGPVRSKGGDVGSIGGGGYVRDRGISDGVAGNLYMEQCSI